MLSVDKIFPPPPRDCVHYAAKHDALAMRRFRAVPRAQG